MTEVLVWEGGVEQRFCKGIARKDLEELEEWGVGVLQEFEMLEDFKAQQIDLIREKNLPFDGLELKQSSPEQEHPETR